MRASFVRGHFRTQGTNSTYGVPAVRRHNTEKHAPLTLKE
jgi:hypothetical protein